MTKPGWTTTEWWSTLIGQVLALVVIVRPSLIVNTGGNGAPLVQAFAVVASALSSGAYTYGRSRVKAASGSVVITVPGPEGETHRETLIQRPGR